ncbi:MAG: RNA-binding S4 domain-containing protein [Pseudomonadota bacterium]
MTDEATPTAEEPAQHGPGQRLDRWLFFARIVKSRSLATRLVQSGKVRVNRQATDKPSQTVRAGDVLTMTLHRRLRILKVLAPGNRRGPADEAQTLYEDLSPPDTGTAPAGGLVLPVPVARRAAGEGRPTKKQRRATDRLREKDE